MCYSLRSLSDFICSTLLNVCVGGCDTLGVLAVPRRDALSAQLRFPNDSGAVCFEQRKQIKDEGLHSF